MATSSSRIGVANKASGTITTAGFNGNVEVCVRYLAAWLDGNGCVPIHWLMEDAATAEIARAQLWQWLHHSDPRGCQADGSPVYLDDGTTIDFDLFERTLAALPGRLGDTIHLPGGARIGEATALLDGLYEHSPWIARAAMAARPFRSLAELKAALVQVVQNASRDAQLGLVRAHPELAGKAMVSNTLTAESTNEQQKAGLTQCTPEELAHIQQLNASYGAKFGFPFVISCSVKATIINKN